MSLYQDPGFWFVATVLLVVIVFVGLLIKATRDVERDAAKKDGK